MDKTIVAIVEHADGSIKANSYDVIAFAEKLSQHYPARVIVTLVGDAVAEPARELAVVTGLDVLAIRTPGVASYTAEVYVAVLHRVLGEMSPAYVCAAHSTQGADFVPWLAIRMNAACITAVEGVRERASSILFSRTILGGKVTAEVASTTSVTMVTVQPAAFTFSSCAEPDPGSVEIRTIDCHLKQSRWVGIKPGPKVDAALSEARVVVSAGRGVGTKENLDLIHQLAELFPQSTIAGSRPVCDLGWLEYKKQVGLTGSTVSPELYIACGISGAVQHCVGMRGSGLIVAINIDPNAPIFNVADVCVVEDLTTFIPVLAAALRNRPTYSTSRK